MTKSLIRISICLAIVSLEHAENSVILVQDAQDPLKSWNQLPSLENLNNAAEGLSQEKQAPVLSWERVYSLALVRHRSKRTSVETALDLKALEQDSRRFEIDDFAKFRDDFLADGPGGFADPSAHFLELLALKQSIEDMQVGVALAENMTWLFSELIKGEAAGLKQTQLDESFQAANDATIRLLERKARFRDRFDAFKFELGLSPDVLLIIDPAELKSFSEPYLESIRWGDSRNREFANLFQIVDRLPKLDQVSIGDGKVFSLIIEPDKSEEFVHAVTRLARENGGPLNPERELRIRHRARDLAISYQSFQSERRKVMLVLRKRDLAFEDLIAPPAPNRDRGSDPALLSVASPAQLTAVEDRLVELWATSQSLRVALYRDLHILPFSDWKSFYAGFRPAASGGVPAVDHRLDAPKAPPPPVQ